MTLLEALALILVLALGIFAVFAAVTAWRRW